MRDVNAWLKQPNLPSYVVGMNGIVMRDFQSLAVKDVIRVLLLRLHSCNYKHTKENERGKLSHVMQPAVLANIERMALRRLGFGRLGAKHERHSAFPIKLDSQLQIEIIKR